MQIMNVFFEYFHNIKITRHAFFTYFVRSDVRWPSRATHVPEKDKCSTSRRPSGDTIVESRNSIVSPTAICPPPFLTSASASTPGSAEDDDDDDDDDDDADAPC